MSEERTIRKLKKLSRRIHSQMETVRDTMEDLELEFEVLNQLIERLESNKNSIPAMSKSGDEHDDIDIENNSTTTTVSPKAPKKF